MVSWRHDLSSASNQWEDLHEIRMQRILTLLALLLIAVLIGGGLFYFWGQGDILSEVARPAAVAPGDVEVAWLHPATNTPTWERFVSGAADYVNLHSDLELDLTQAYPEASIKPPAIGIKRKSQPGWLWIRWYKLTGERPTYVWVNALLKRNPPPVAFIGGGSSDRARDLAASLENYSWKSPADRPPLLITTATADAINYQGNPVSLMQIYKDRSFRLSYTNSQMAKATMSFIEHLKTLPGYFQPEFELPPEFQTGFDREQKVHWPPQPVLIGWEDDSYSKDLANCFRNLLLPEFKPEVILGKTVGHGVGGLDYPNRQEYSAIESIRFQVKMSEPAYRNHLLILPGAATPCKRFLKTLHRLNPTEVRSWFVATADSIDWNSICRDRRLVWPVEEVPFKLAFFMHRNPVEVQAGFPAALQDDMPKSALTGTDDKLLYRDATATVFQAIYPETGIRRDPAQLSQELANAKDERGNLLFEPGGNRPEKGGEFIGLLLPQYEGILLKTYAILEVWNRQVRPDQTEARWELIRTLTLSYHITGSTGGIVQP